MVKTIKCLRLRNYDYTTDGYYFVTVCSNFRKNFSDNEKTVILEQIDNISTISLGIRIDFYELLNNHLHMIIVLEKCKMNLSEIIRRFKAKTSKQLCNKLWQSNFYEHVIRTDKSLEVIRKYIKDNPLKKQIDWDKIYKKSN